MLKIGKSFDYVQNETFMELIAVTENKMNLNVLNDKITKMVN